MKKLKETSVKGEFEKLYEYFEAKYREDLYNLGYCSNENDEKENEILEKLIMKYYRERDKSEFFIEEICFVHRLINNISLKNGILCQSFGNKYIWRNENFETEKLYLNN